MYFLEPYHCIVSKTHSKLLYVVKVQIGDSGNSGDSGDSGESRDCGDSGDFGDSRDSGNSDAADEGLLCQVRKNRREHFCAESASILDRFVRLTDFERLTKDP